MGYTHYWYVKRDADREKLAEAGREMGRAVEASAVPLADWNGEGRPQADSEGGPGTVRFNGQGPEDDHETFSWPPDLGERQEYLSGNQDEVFTFCKTARKPYDAVVVACLLRAKAIMGDAIRVHTDAGDEEEFAGQDVSEGWQGVNAMLGHPTEHSGETATELYRRVYGEAPDLSGIFDEEEVEA